MAHSDKNIVITPNTSSTTADPQIVFSGANASLGPQNITVRAYPTNNGTLSFEGSAGQLFSLTNTMTGTVFSATDVSGIPSIEVIDTGLVKLAQYGGNILIGTGTDLGAKLQVSASTPTSVGSVPSGTTMIMSSNTNNYLLFRNTGDNGTYSGLAFQDNNVGGYVIFGNAGGGGDQLYLAGYGGVVVQYGAADSIDRTARTTVATFNASGITLSTGNFVGNVTGNVSGSSASCTGNAASATTADQIDSVAFRNTGSNSAVNADNLDSNGVTYYTSGVTNFSGNSTDGALYSQAYSSSWQHQIAGDYRSGQIAVRGKNSGTWQSWKIIATNARVFAQNLILG